MTVERMCQTNRAISIVLILAANVLVFGCGSKGPPVPKAAIIPPSIQDLTAKVLGNKVILTWSIPKQDDKLFEGIKRFKVFRHAVHDSDPPCPGCPLTFHEIMEIMMSNPHPAQIQEGKVGYAANFKTGFRYAFNVIVYHESGGVSGDSNIIRIP